MQALTPPARRGWRWLAEGFGISPQSAQAFARRAQLLDADGVDQRLPLIGQLTATLLIPVFSVSLMNACRLLEQGSPLPLQLLFSGFQQTRARC